MSIITFSSIPLRLTPIKKNNKAILSIMIIVSNKLAYKITTALGKQIILTIISFHILKFFRKILQYLIFTKNFPHDLNNDSLLIPLPPINILFKAL